MDLFLLMALFLLIALFLLLPPDHLPLDPPPQEDTSSPLFLTGVVTFLVSFCLPFLLLGTFLLYTMWQQVYPTRYLPSLKIQFYCTACTVSCRCKQSVSGHFVYIFSLLYILNNITGSVD